MLLNTHIGFIYKTTNRINGKSYIGLCANKRDSDSYLGSGKLILQAIEKYGRDNFDREILEYCETDQSLRDAEIRWIEKFDAVNSDMFYNLHEGGRGGYIHKPKGTMTKPIKKYWDNLSEDEYKSRCSNMGKYDKSGNKNPRARRALVNGTEYECLKDALIDFPHIPYSSLKRYAHNEKYNEKYNFKAKYL